MCLVTGEIRRLKEKGELDYIEVYPYMNLILYGNSNHLNKQYEVMFDTEEDLNKLLDNLDRLQIDYKEYNAD